MEVCQSSISPFRTQNYQHLTLLAQDVFFFKEQKGKLIQSRVRLYDHLITIQEQDSPFNKFKLELNFDTVFSILMRNSNEEEENTHSGIPYGIKFQRYPDQTQILSFKDSGVIIKWRDLLKKKLNQRNFHQIFKPIKKVGQGNFASVYLVSKNEDKQLYAVKAFSKQLQYEDQRGKQCLQNEINIMRSLQNQYLMKLEGVYETDNSIYFVVQYLRGGLLYDKIKRKSKFSTEQIMQIMSSLLKGILAMHSKKIMHRDLKPENILFRDQQSYECVIADFGLATFSDINEYLFTRCGTPGYVAPQISNLKDRKAHYDPICDMFSLGVIFHIILLGQSPFPGTSCDEVLQQNRECRINFQQKIYGSIHPNWLDLLKRMLQKDPSNRISAAQALNHPFFEGNETQILEQLPVQKYDECDSPLMISRNVQRKRNLRLRDDSCLKFKMRQNIPYNKDDQEYIQKISSPLKKKIARPRRDRNSKTFMPSHFRQ